MRFLLNLFRFIWRMFWRLVWAGIVAFIILVSVLYLTNPSQTGLTAVRQAVQTAVRYFFRSTRDSHWTWSKCSKSGRAFNRSTCSKFRWSTLGDC